MRCSSAHMAIPASDRTIAISVDLSEESSYALQWAVENYLRKTDKVSTAGLQWCTFRREICQKVAGFFHSLMPLTVVWCLL
jgi:hypothetical protein